jgi:hypothetical protein
MEIRSRRLVLRDYTMWTNGHRDEEEDATDLWPYLVNDTVPDALRCGLPLGATPCESVEGRVAFTRLESLRELVQGREFGGGEEGFRGAEEEPAFFAGCADDESRVLQRLESMAPVRALQFEESAGSDRLAVIGWR